MLFFASNAGLEVKPGAKHDLFVILYRAYSCAIMNEGEGICVYIDIK